MAGKEFQTRYYETEMPDVGDVVMVKVASMKDSSCYVRLLEYDNIEGMIPTTELSKRRIRSINQLVKPGRVLIVVVIRVDKEKKYIDLSKKQVTSEERRLCEERFRKAKTVTGIMCSAALELKIKPLELMQKVAWPLYRPGMHAYDMLKQATLSPAEILDKLGLEPHVYAQVEATIKTKLKAEVLKIQADLNVTCFTSEGVDAIRDVLLFAQSFMPDDAKGEEGLVSVHVLAPPTYSLYTFSDDKEAGFRRLAECIEMMRKMMAQKGGNLEVANSPHVVGHEGADAAKTDMPAPETDSSEGDE